MFKKPLIFVCMTVIMFLLICGCAAKQEASLPQLVIGCNNYEPYYYADADGEPAGMDVDLAKEACARMGYVPVFRQINWNERDAALESGEVDCLWSCLTMDVLPDDYAWVGPYMRSRQVVAVLEDSPIHTLSDLTGKRVAVRTGSKAEKLFLEMTGENIPQVEKVYSQNQTDEIATALRNGYVDAIAGYAATVRKVLQKENVQYRFIDEELSHATFGIAFLKDSKTAVRDALSETLSGMLADGTTASILKRYGVDTAKALGGLAGE